MGVLDKFLDIMKLSDDDDYEDDDFFDDDYDDDYEDEKPKKGIFSRLMKSDDDDDYDDDDYIEERSSSKRSNSTAVSNKVTPMRPSNRRANNVSMEVCVIKPASVDDSREICETLLSGRTVILIWRDWILRLHSVSLTLFQDLHLLLMVIFRRFQITYSL